MLYLFSWKAVGSILTFVRIFSIERLSSELSIRTDFAFCISIECIFSFSNFRFDRNAECKIRSNRKFTRKSFNRKDSNESQNKPECVLERRGGTDMGKFGIT